MKRFLLLIGLALVCVAPASANIFQPVVIVNHSTSVSDAEVRAALPSLQRVVTEDLFPIWNTSCVLRFGDSPLVPGEWTITLEDTSIYIGILGYHAIGMKTNQPFGQIFTEVSAGYQTPWTVVLSHEIYELLTDSHLHRRVKVDKRQYVVEIADPVQEDTYLVDGVAVSDFVTPNFFRPHSAFPYDHLHLVKKALKPRPGGAVFYYQWGRLFQVWG